MQDPCRDVFSCDAPRVGAGNGPPEVGDILSLTLLRITGSW